MKRLIFLLITLGFLSGISQTKIKLNQLEPAATSGSVIVSGPGGVATYSNLSATWQLNGNAISTNTNFIGTTTNRSLIFKTNNVQYLKLDSTGKVSQEGLGGGTFFGYKAGMFDAAANNGSNTAFGYNALKTATNTFVNSAFGAEVLSNNTTGNSNSGFGYVSLYNNTIGGNNTAIGESSMYGNTTGNNNTAVGKSALVSNSIGNENTAIGFRAMQLGGDCEYNVAVGTNALYLANTGAKNTTIGGYSLYSNTSGAGNTCIGYDALARNTTGIANVAVGYYAGEYNTTESNRFYLNNQDRATQGGDTTASLLYGIFNATPSLQVLKVNAGNLHLNAVGSKINIKEGANSSVGTATLVSGVITVTNINITDKSHIMVTGRGNANMGTLYTTRSNGSSFTINSNNPLDTRVIDYIIIEGQ